MTLETQRRGWVSDTCPLSGDSENLSGTEALVDDPDSNHIDACDTDKLSGDLGPAEVSVEFGDQPEEDPNLLKCTLAQDGQPPLSPRRSTPMSLRIDAPLPPDTPPPTPPRPCPAKIGTLTPQPLALTRPASLRAPGTGLDTFPSRTQVSIPAVNDGGNGSDDGQDAIDLMTQTPVTENPQPTHHLKSLKVDDHVVVGPGTCKMIASSTRAARNLRERNQPIAVCIDIGQHGKDTVHYARCANLALSHLVLPGWHYLEVLTIHDAHSALECGSGLARLFLPGVDYMLAFGPNPSANEEPWDEMARILRSLVSTLEQREVRRVRVILPFNGYGTLPPSSACAGRLATATTSLSHDLQSIAQHLVLGERPTWVEIDFLLVELIPARCASCRHPWTRII
ncbi:hypothetical protein CspeluHIS016_0102620 [Cutaneotrichosporon spelunceum]|uniref:Uncharacterized protein n=1 Tax=Cutaneotrichosporon spelunceum TaxID=1672016 RepID=A0AAD3Y7R0_9TREE|nr:hypothetical protein CspeluHIS016_0102620 [Cutaneotrichosporon spelunceum]